jgi:Bacterial Ig domain
MRALGRSLALATLLIGLSAPRAALAIGQPPVTTDDQYVTGVDAILTVDAPGLLDNDADDHGVISVVTPQASGPDYGTLTSLNSVGSFTYVPASGFHGVDRFTYRTTDGDEESDPPATVTITVDDPPVAAEDSYLTGEGQTLTVGAPGLLVNDTDPDAGGSVTVVTPAESDPANGTLALNADGSFTYSPNLGFAGTDQFTYRAFDKARSSDPATVTITVDDPPVASDDAYNVRQGRTLTVGLSNRVLANDSDDSISAVLESTTAGGTVNFNADGTFTYITDPSFVGDDTFTYHATDGTLNSAPARVTVSVQPDLAPIANDDSYGPIRAGSGLRANVLFNDSDLDDDKGLLQAQQLSNPRFGSLDLGTDGRFEYRPLPGVCNRIDQFTYQATDGVLSSAPATVTIPIATSLKATTLTLTRSAGVVTYGRSLLLTAHLSRFSASAAISIYRTPVGGSRTRLARARPDASGNVEIRARPGRRTTYRAISTDNCFDPATAPARTVGVAPVIAGGFVAPFGHRGPFALYHHDGRAPHYRGTVTPSHPSGPVRFVWQRRSGGQWRKYYTSGTLHLTQTSAIDVYMTGGVTTRVPYRVKVVFLGDRDHLAGAGAWSNFMAV